MADIRIEKKRRSIWPWILGILLVVGLVWVVAELSDKEQPEMARNTEQTTTDQPVSGQQPIDQQSQEQSQVQEPVPEDNINAYVSFIEEREVAEKMGVDPQLTGDALDRLSVAMKDLTGDDPEFEQQLNSVQQTAQQIQQDPTSMEQADKVTEAISSASDVLRQIQENRFPEAEQSVKQVEEAANSLNSEGQLMDQQEEVRTFFEESANALEEMKDQASS